MQTKQGKTNVRANENFYKEGKDNSPLTKKVTLEREGMDAGRNSRGLFIRIFQSMVGEKKERHRDDYIAINNNQGSISITTYSWHLDRLVGTNIFSMKRNEFHPWNRQIQIFVTRIGQVSQRTICTLEFPRSFPKAYTSVIWTAARYPFGNSL